jgi:membrane-bound serine protease (ClpP class)
MSGTFLRRIGFAGFALALLLAPQARAEDSSAPATVPATAPAAQAVAGLDSFPDGSPPPGARVFGPEDDWVTGWFPPPERPVRPENPQNVYVLPIREPITQKTYDSLSRKVLQARGGGADLIVLDLDTFGGAVLPALEITRLLKTELDDIHTVALVRTRAISAGAMIALACDEIVMTDVGTLGDCAPIAGGGQTIGEVEREKIETVLRKEFTESARRSGYSPELARSMVTWKIEVRLQRNERTGELRFVQNGPESSSDADAGPWKDLRTLVREGELLTMDTTDAVRYGFCREVVDAPDSAPYDALLASFAAPDAEPARPQVLSDTWSEDLVDFLQHPLVVAVLTLGMIMFAYVEMHTPGFGVFGGIALGCLALLLFGGYLSNMAQWWEIALLGLGIVLLLLEVLVIPGFGVAGIAGIVCVLAAGLAMMVANAPDQWPIPAGELAWDRFSNLLAAVLLGAAAAVIAAVAISKYLPRLPITHRLILEPVSRGDDRVPAGEQAPLRQVQPGDEAVTATALRPAGKIRFREALLDAQANGPMIDSGTRVRVVAVDGNRVLVEPVG